METLKEFWYNRINPKSRSERHFVIETTLEIRCEFARIDARDGDYEKKKTSKEYEYHVIEEFINSVKCDISRIPYIAKPIPYQIVRGTLPMFRKCDISIIPESHTRRYIVLTINGQKWYVDPTVDNWHSRHFSTGDRPFYVSTKKPKYVVMKDVISEGVICPV